jgi:hypothetical protein
MMRGLVSATYPLSFSAVLKVLVAKVVTPLVYDAARSL